MSTTVTEPTRRAGRPKSVEKRRAILLASSELFLERGFDAVSMDEVATRAGVSKQTVYSHFSGKEELFQSCIAGKLSEHSLSLADLPPDIDFVTALGEMSRRFLELINDPGVIAMHRAVIAQSVHHPEVATLFYDSGPRRAIDVVAELLAEGAAADAIEVDDPGAAAELLLCMLKRLGDLRCMVEVAPPLSPAERDARAAETVEMFLRLHEPGGRDR